MNFQSPTSASTHLPHRSSRREEADKPFQFQRFNAFTLIELLVVIAIIVVIAALLIPAANSMVKKSIVQRAVSERDQLETAIDAYKAKYGFYPPSNATGNPLINQLYYELLGTTNTGSAFVTLDGGSQMSSIVLPTIYGVSAFMNASKPGGGEDSVPATTFLSGLKAGEIGTYNITNGTGTNTFIVTAANSDLSYKPMPGIYSLAGRPANPWRYVCPGTNNPNSYDLWVQVFLGNKTYLICNWSKNPQINVPMP